MPSVHVGLGHTWLWPLVRKRAKPAQSIAITLDPDGTLCTYEVYSTEERRGTPTTGHRNLLPGHSGSI